MLRTWLYLTETFILSRDLLIPNSVTGWVYKKNAQYVAQQFLGAKVMHNIFPIRKNCQFLGYF
jgi:hypothetical protein